MKNPFSRFLSGVIIGLIFASITVGLGYPESVQAVIGYIIALAFLFGIIAATSWNKLQKFLKFVFYGNWW